MHHPTDRIAHTTVVEHRLEQEIAQWVHKYLDSHYIDGYMVAK